MAPAETTACSGHDGYPPLQINHANLLLLSYEGTLLHISQLR